MTFGMEFASVPELSGNLLKEWEAEERATALKAGRDVKDVVSAVAVSATQDTGLTRGDEGRGGGLAKTFGMEFAGVPELSANLLREWEAEQIATALKEGRDAKDVAAAVSATQDTAFSKWAEPAAERKGRRVAEKKREETERMMREWEEEENTRRQKKAKAAQDRRRKQKELSEQRDLDKKKKRTAKRRAQRDYLESGHVKREVTDVSDRLLKEGKEKNHRRKVSQQHHHKEYCPGKPELNRRSRELVKKMNGGRGRNLNQMLAEDRSQDGVPKFGPFKQAAAARERQVEEEAKQLSNTELSGTSFMRNSNHIKTYKDEYKYLQPTLSTRERARARALGTHDACLAEVYQQCAGGRHLRPGQHSALGDAEFEDEVHACEVVALCVGGGGATPRPVQLKEAPTLVPKPKVLQTSFLKKFEQHQNRASSPRLRGKPTYDAETLSTSQRTKTDKSFSMNEIANSFWDKDNTATVALFKGINEPGVVSAVAVHVPDTDVKGPAWGASGCQGAFSTLPTGRGQAGHGAPVQLTAIAAQLGQLAEQLKGLTGTAGAKFSANPAQFESQRKKRSVFSSKRKNTQGRNSNSSTPSPKPSLSSPRTSSAASSSMRTPRSATVARTASHSSSRSASGGRLNAAARSHLTTSSAPSSGGRLSARTGSASSSSHRRSSSGGKGHRRSSSGGKAHGPVRTTSGSSHRSLGGHRRSTSRRLYDEPVVVQGTVPTDPAVTAAFEKELFDEIMGIFAEEEPSAGTETKQAPTANVDDFV